MKIRHILIENTWLYWSSHGWGNGYVVIPNKYGHLLDDDKFLEGFDQEITFSEPCSKISNKVFNLSKEEIENCYIIGFDTAHFGMTQENWPKSRVEEVALDLKRRVVEAIAKHGK